MKYRLAAVSLFALVASTLLVCLLAAEPASPLAPIAPLAQAFTSPSSVKAVPPPCAVFMPSSGFPGDCVVITFTHNLPIVPISNATVLLLDARGKTVARSEAFTTATDITSALLTEGTTLAGSTQAYAKEGHTGFPDILPRKPVLVAILALPHDLSSGQYRIQTHYLAGATIIADEKPFTLEARTFPSEEITFNGKNTAIKKNMSFKRLTEIKKLNDLLIYQGQNAPRFPGPFVLPVRTQRITSFFAQSRTLRYSTGQSEEAVHYGIDFGIPTGSQVSAAGDGLVVMTENRISTGWTIVIEHDPGIYSLYYHLDTLLVRNGALVHSGDLIARSGATGLATGPHLHWEFRVNGEAVSPDWFIGRKLY